MRRRPFLDAFTAFDDAPPPVVPTEVAGCLRSPQDALDEAALIAACRRVDAIATVWSIRLATGALLFFAARIFL